MHSSASRKQRLHTYSNIDDKMSTNNKATLFTSGRQKEQVCAWRYAILQKSTRRHYSVRSDEMATKCNVIGNRTLHNGQVWINDQIANLGPIRVLRPNWGRKRLASDFTTKIPTPISAIWTKWGHHRLQARKALGLIL